MTRYRLAATVLVVGSLAVGMTACGSSDKTDAGSTATPTVSTDSDLAAMVPAKYTDKGYVSVASDIPYPPMEMFDASGKPTGLDYDLSQALAAKLGITFKFEKQAWDTIIASLKSGNHDIIMSGMNDTPERQKTLDFVDYFKGGMAIMVSKGNPDGVTNLMDLCGKTVAVQTSTVQADLVSSASADCPAGTSIEIKKYPTDNDAQSAVRAGTATADVLDAAVAAYAAQTAGAGNYFEIVNDPENPEGYQPIYTGIGVLKADNKLALAIQAALQALIDDGTYADIMAKYDVDAYSVDKAGLNLGA